MSRHIVLIAQFAGAPEYGMVYGHYYLAREWVAMGHRVTILAASHSHLRFRQPDTVGAVTVETLDGIEYRYLRVPVARGDQNVRRAAAIFTFTAAAFRALQDLDHADVVVATSHHPLAILPAQRLSRRDSASLVFEVRDLWPLTLIEAGGMKPRHPFIRLLQWAEDHAYRVADHVVSVLPRADEYMETHGMAPGKFVYVPNGADAASGSLEPLSEEYVARIRAIDGSFLVGYAGTIGLANGLNVLIRAAALRPEVGVAIVGYGAAVLSIRALAAELGITDRVAILDPIPKAQVGAFLSELDAAFISLAPHKLFHYGVSPTKLNDYMLAGRPIVTAIDGYVEAVEKSGAGLLCNPTDLDAVSDALGMLAAMSEAEREAMGRKGREWVLTHRKYPDLARYFLDAVLPTGDPYA